MLSLLLEKKRKKAQKTVLGVEYDFASLAAVKLDKKNQEYSLVCCSSDIFSDQAYFEGELISEYIGNIVSNIILANKLGFFTRLGFVTYKDIDISKEEIVCDKKNSEIIAKEGVVFYLREHFLKKKFPENYSVIAFDFYDESEEKGIITIYYIADIKITERFYNIAKKSKKAVSVCGLDNIVISNFVQELFLSEISKHTTNSILFGLYADKLCVYSFSPSGELKNYEAVKIFEPKISDANYVDEAIQLLLRFIDFMSLDFSGNDFSDFSAQDNAIYIYGIKENFEKIFSSIKELSAKDCRILDPFVNIQTQDYKKTIEKPYRYVMPVAIAMMEAL
ncbi:type IV pili [Allofrancisella guangzhouensis]|uniref:Type IV pili n=1 Tax=Allofrancisella guangzhouensis TaxID=594679 RepID=A0A0A8E4J4_9GAMM|nr:hypothetical protein [Allofrancisella guangzhouensis]AJC49130.1 type IV pili [Allofrancisella guangzhouensis]MBK2026847.1 type IV pili [Allofrancisella guangzhouensis]MBK2043597.1 type IV pili [Allofrancisella guangzhouensis]MBK2046344.1 type IV pili [Allofrancisella guangzhouensis]